MEPSRALCVAVFLVGAFLSAVSQALLKKSALEPHKGRLGEYLNAKVVAAYALVAAVLLANMTVGYRKVTLSESGVLSSTSYIYVFAFGALFFRERITRRKFAGLVLILVGIAVYSCLG